MKDVKNELLVAAAKELNELLFDPDDEDIIDLKLEPDQLIIQIKDAAQLLEPNDDLTKETTQILKDLDIENEKEEPEELTLFEEIEEAERMKDLKDIVKSNDEFKGIRGKLSSYKSKKELQSIMLKILDGAKGQEKEKVESEKVKPAYVKKEEEKVQQTGKKKGAKSVEKKEKAVTISRSDAVAQAIRKLCKHGATIKEIMDKGDEIYVEAGGESKSNTSTVNRHMLNALVEFDILFKDDDKYKFKK